jgi:chromosome segregation ATPase
LENPGETSSFTPHTTNTGPEVSDGNISTKPGAAGSEFDTGPSATKPVEKSNSVDPSISDIMKMLREQTSLLQNMGKDASDHKHEFTKFRENDSKKTTELSEKIDNILKSQKGLNDAVGTLQTEYKQLKSSLAQQGEGIIDNIEQIKELKQDKAKFDELTDNLTSKQKDLEVKLAMTNLTLASSKADTKKLQESMIALQDRLGRLEDAVQKK